MTSSLRPLIGFGAAFVTMAMVVIAGMTAPAAKTTLHASAECRDGAKPQTPSPARPEAERPA